MRGLVMSLRAASSGFVFLLLIVPVIQGQSDLRVNYTDTHICAPKGSTVEMSCRYSNLSTINTFWSTKGINNSVVALKTDSDYTGRVDNKCDGKGKRCTLRIRDLRESDSAVYRFTITTNEGRKYTGEPGVTLSVTDPDLRLLMERLSDQVRLKCHSSFKAAARPSFVWYRNELKTKLEGPSIRVNVNTSNRYSCALKACEDHRSPPVYAPKLPSVSVNPSAGIMEGRSVTLTCSSDANPAANYTWYKMEETLKHLSDTPRFVFTSTRPSDSGEYVCAAQNELGKKMSARLSVDVEYAPKLPSVSVSPSAEIVEGSSVTLTCSSDANPPANYVWYKVDEDSPKASGQVITIADFSGSYICEAQNSRGRHNSTLNMSPVSGKSVMIMNIIRLTLMVLILIPVIVVSLWTRKKKTLSSDTGPNEAEMREVRDREILQNSTTLNVNSLETTEDVESHPDYENLRL